jgi:hypothetical protein
MVLIFKGYNQHQLHIIDGASLKKTQNKKLTDVKAKKGEFYFVFLNR